MKLIIAIIQDEYINKVVKALMTEKIRTTKLSSTGGFLKAGNTTIIVGTEDDKVEHVISLIGEESQKRTEVVPSSASYDLGRFASFPVEVEVGGATIFVLDIEQFLKL